MADTIKAIIKLRGGTKAQWESNNTVLLDRQKGVVTGQPDDPDYGKEKMGDGITPWNNLPYIVGTKGAKGDKGNDGADGAKGDKGDTGNQGEPGPGVPTGGTTGQILAKNTDDDYDTKWIDETTGGGGEPSIILVETNDEYNSLDNGSVFADARGGATGDYIIKWKNDTGDIPFDFTGKDWYALGDSYTMGQNPSGGNNLITYPEIIGPSLNMGNIHNIAVSGSAAVVLTIYGYNLDTEGTLSQRVRDLTVRNIYFANDDERAAFDGLITIAIGANDWLNVNPIENGGLFSFFIGLNADTRTPDPLYDDAINWFNTNLAALNDPANMGLGTDPTVPAAPIITSFGMDWPYVLSSAGALYMCCAQLALKFPNAKIVLFQLACEDLKQFAVNIGYTNYLVPSTFNLTHWENMMAFIASKFNNVSFFPTQTDLISKGWTLSNLDNKVGYDKLHPTQDSITNDLVPLVKSGLLNI